MGPPQRFVWLFAAACGAAAGGPAPPRVFTRLHLDGSLADSGADDNGVSVADFPNAPDAVCNGALALGPGRGFPLRSPPRGVPRDNDPWTVGFSVLPVAFGERALFHMGGDGAYGGGVALVVTDAGRLQIVDYINNPVLHESIALPRGDWTEVALMYDGRALRLFLNSVMSYAYAVRFYLKPPSAGASLSLGGVAAGRMNQGTYYIDEVSCATGIVPLDDLRPPCTPAPPTPAPTLPTAAPPAPTLAPPTPSPTPRPTPAPSEPPLGLDPAHKATVNAVEGAAAGAALMSGGSVGSVGRLAVLKNFACEMDDVDLNVTALDFEFHPSGVAIGGGAHRYLLGAAIMNPVIVAGVVVALFLVSTLFHYYYGYPWERALGNARAYGLAYIPYLFLLQGTSLVGMQLALYSDAPHETFVGAASLAACYGSPLWLYHQIIRRVRVKCVCIPDPVLYPDDPLVKTMLLTAQGGEVDMRRYTGWVRTAYRFAYGETIWVNQGENSYFAEKHGAIYESLKDGKQWFCLAEIAVMLLLSGFSAWKPRKKAECNARNTLIVVFLLWFLVLVARHRPYAAPMDNTFSFVLALFMFVACTFMTISIWVEADPEGWLFGASFWLLLLSAVFLMIKCVWDFGSYSFDIWIGRRFGARDLARRGGGLGDAKRAGSDVTSGHDVECMECTADGNDRAGAGTDADDDDDDNPPSLNVSRHLGGVAGAVTATSEDIQETSMTTLLNASSTSQYTPPPHPRHRRSSQLLSVSPGASAVASSTAGTAHTASSAGTAASIPLKKASLAEGAGRGLRARSLSVRPLTDMGDSSLGCDVFTPVSGTGKKDFVIKRQGTARTSPSQPDALLPQKKRRRAQASSPCDGDRDSDDESAALERRPTIHLMPVGNGTPQVSTTAARLATLLVDPDVHGETVSSCDSPSPETEAPPAFPNNPRNPFNMRRASMAGRVRHASFQAGRSVSGSLPLVRPGAAGEGPSPTLGAKTRRNTVASCASEKCGGASPQKQTKFYMGGPERRDSIIAVPRKGSPQPPAPEHPLRRGSMRHVPAQAAGDAPPAPPPAATAAPAAGLAVRRMSRLSSARNWSRKEVAVPRRVESTGDVSPSKPPLGLRRQISTARPPVLARRASPLGRADSSGGSNDGSPLLTDPQSLTLSLVFPKGAGGGSDDEGAAGLLATQSSVSGEEPAAIVRQGPPQPAMND
eukprot:TRINITY_DN16043_c0_g4_i2.p1 TRINITY_DN16043_c0_g4~~TRINITY_DN16043_c0_g4_i2.p1  ORF type:complete len:1198 (+),score=301.63 TRINITY_DN16043_c0_g4_i2:34-3627(+)